MQGIVPIRLAARMIALILLATYPIASSAQVPPYAAPTSSASGVMSAAYQPPTSPTGDGQPSQALSAGRPVSSSPVPLKPHEPAAEPGSRTGGFRSAAAVAGSLAIVLGLFLLIAWALRRASPHGQNLLPAEAFELLGRAPLANRQQVHLLRCGNKLLLVSVGTAGAAAQTLAEITDPAEVERIAALCRRARSIGPAGGIRQVFRHSEGRNA